MTNPKKVQAVQKLQEKLAKAKSLVLADFSGLTVPQQEKIRTKVQETGGEFTVVKNTLLKRAFQANKSLPQELSQPEILQKPTAILLGYEDQLAPLKILANFCEEFDLPKIKIAFLEGTTLEEKAFLDLAKLPSQEELQAKLVAIINQPARSLVYVLTADLRNLIFILANLKKGGEN